MRSVPKGSDIVVSFGHHIDRLPLLPPLARCVQPESHNRRILLCRVARPLCIFDFRPAPRPRCLCWAHELLQDRVHRAVCISYLPHTADIRYARVRRYLVAPLPCSDDTASWAPQKHAGAAFRALPPCVHEEHAARRANLLSVSTQVDPC